MCKSLISLRAEAEAEVHTTYGAPLASEPPLRIGTSRLAEDA